MQSVRDFFVDESGSAMVEYSLTFALFGVFCLLGMTALYMQTQNSLINTRARAVCNSITLRSDIVASTDDAGNISCK